MKISLIGRSYRRRKWLVIAITLVMSGVIPSAVLAAPWFNPGDPRMRHSLQQLADRGHLNRGVTTWPMMVGSVDGGLDHSRAGGDAVSARSLGYVNLERERQSSRGSRAGVAVSLASEDAFLQGFALAPRDNQAQATYEYSAEYLALGLSYAYALDPEDTQNHRFDGSYVALTAANLAVGAGYLDRWWGPGWQSSLILSTNARPIPAFWVSRVDEKPFDLPLLRLLGPWQFTLFAGQLEKERDHANAKMVGMRFTLRPLQGLDIGFARTFTYGGEGQQQGRNVLGRILVGRSNDNYNGRPVADQIGSIDIRYGFSVADYTLGLYGQMMGEDEAGAFPAKKSWLFGLDATSSFRESNQQWFIEYSNTLADNMFGDGLANVSYEHGNWRTGNRYLGRNQASTFEGDSRNLTAGLFNFFPNGHHLGVSVAFAELNVKDAPVRATITDPDITYYIPAEKTDILFFNLSYGMPLGAGQLDLALQLQDDTFQRASGGKQEQVAVGALYKHSF